MYIPQPQTQLFGPGLSDHLISSVYLTPGEQTKQDVYGVVWNSLFGFETLRGGDSQVTMKKNTEDVMTKIPMTFSRALFECLIHS